MTNRKPKNRIRPPPWCQEELTILRELFPLCGKRLTARALPRRTIHAVAMRAYELKLRSRADRSKKTRWKPGQTPWNKGMKGYKPMSSNRYFFQPGHRPHTWRPVGSERIDDDGYLVRKVSDDKHPARNSKRNWRQVHVLEWEKHHGPVPSGHVVIFKNGDKSDIRLENLEMIDRSELMRRNSIHENYPPELARAMSLLGTLKYHINRRKDNGSQ